MLDSVSGREDHAGSEEIDSNSEDSESYMAFVESDHIEVEERHNKMVAQIQMLQGKVEDLQRQFQVLKAKSLQNSTDCYMSPPPRTQEKSGENHFLSLQWQLHWHISSKH